MSVSEAITSTLPRLRPELDPRPIGKAGRYVVKDAAAGTYFQIGEQECFLLRQLDGRQSAGEIRAAFEQRFGEPLSQADLDELVELGQSKGLLTHEPSAANEANANSPTALRPAKAGKERQNPLFYRIKLLDPDRFLNWLEPKLRFVFTRSFVVLSCLLFVSAGVVGFTNRQEWISMFPNEITFQTVFLLWLLICLVTTLHEFAHGLACKHFGGEVHEIGFLMLLFMPSLYCNVSDAWLFRERWKRMLVGAAGTYWDLCIWAAATLVWRLTIQDTALNYVAWMLSTLTLARAALNLNPLIRLDGYYLLGDWLEIPNLADKGRQRFESTVRWLAWGGPRPAAEPKSWFILLYGAWSWLFLLSIVVAMLGGLVQFQFAGWNALRLGLSVIMLWLLSKSLFLGITGWEVWEMIKHRRLRLAAWVSAVILVPAVVGIIPIRDTSSGSFQVRPATRQEICATEAGFLNEINVAEGSPVSAGALLARLHIPDLASNISKKQAEVRESQANLRRLKAGPRPEELAEQRHRVQRAADWRDLAVKDLAQARQSHREDLRRLERQVELYTVTLANSRNLLSQAEQLFERNALSGVQRDNEKTKCLVAALQLEQSQSQRAAREALGVAEYESELARREKELADQRATLKLLEAGTRREEIEAEEARLSRLSEELRYFEGMEGRLGLTSPVAGLVTTPRMHEKNGQFLQKGAIVCVVEDLGDLLAEISVREEDESFVSPGQIVELRPRALPFHSFRTVVDRKAPSAVVAQGKIQGTVTVYCRLTESEAEMLSGMTGLARIHRGYKPLGLVMFNRALRYLRTEFWL